MVTPLHCESEEQFSVLTVACYKTIDFNPYIEDVKGSCAKLENRLPDGQYFHCLYLFVSTFQGPYHILSRTKNNRSYII